MDKEYIICAANWYDKSDLKITHQPINIDKGVVVCGHRHHNIIELYCRLTTTKIGDNCIQGFLTNTNRFVDRKEGSLIAFQSGQILEPKDTLYSEDLY